MKILYLGDIMAQPGIKVVERLLPQLKKDYQLDFVVAQAENVTSGKGMSKADFKHLKALGIDAFTGGNHSLDNSEITDDLNDPQQPVVRPANLPRGAAGQPYKFVQTAQGSILVVSVMGSVVGKAADMQAENALITIDQILEATKDQPKIATIVNLHGDFSSEKVMFGHYLDGRVSMVVGDHWHIPTADAMVLPQGTAYVTDVGMCGILHSSLGVTFDSVIPRWRDGVVTRNEIETKGKLQLNGVVVDFDIKNQRARSIKSVRKIIEQ